tara:strand:+ start:397 stop:675 length:279 start_codon:yes stop_codon:yes gene_type:complete
MKETIWSILGAQAKQLCKNTIKFILGTDNFFKKAGATMVIFPLITGVAYGLWCAIGCAEIVTAVVILRILLVPLYLGALALIMSFVYEEIDY